ncbi:hypothetical protein F4861DRAFT_543898 [Xylaria intraflava]|nr:hypothetical protein F4861DRAFT_543898 [Xylaria intraflava]
MALEAQNVQETADMLTLAHGCVFDDENHPSNNPELSRLPLVEALIQSMKLKLGKMEAIADRIKDRTDLIKHLEESDQIVATPGPSHGRVVQPSVTNATKPSSNSQRKPSNCNTKNEQIPVPSLMDLGITPISMPTLEPIRANNAPVTGTNPHPLSISMTETELLPTKQNQVKTVQVWDNEEHRDKILSFHTRVLGPRADNLPLIFNYGIQYNPDAPVFLGENLTFNKAEYGKCRMVVIQGLDPVSTIKEVLDKVRGGQILTACKVTDRSAHVTFVEGLAAEAYVKYAKEHPSAMKIRGSYPNINLAGTPSYPIRASIRHKISRHGITRVLAFPSMGSGVQSFLRHHKSLQQIEDEHTEFIPVKETNSPLSEVKTGHTTTTTTTNNNTGGNVAAASAVINSTTITATTVVSFRAISYAEHVHTNILKRFPASRIYFAPDRCAGPLEELSLNDEALDLKKPHLAKITWGSTSQTGVAAMMEHRETEVN